MEPIDGKSLIIGALLTSTIFFGVASTNVISFWDDKQEWIVVTAGHLEDMGLMTDDENEYQYKSTGGWEPYATELYRKRVK